MRVWRWLLTAALLPALAGCGGGGSSSSTPTPSPTPSPYVATDAGFSAVFPTTPQKQTQNVNQNGVSLLTTLYLATTNDEQIVVAYTQLPVAPQGGAVQAGLDGGVNGSAQNVNGKIESRNNTTFLGQPAEDAVITAQGQVVHERIVFFGRKLFVLEGVTNSLNAKHPWYDRLLATFKTL